MPDPRYFELHDHIGVRADNGSLEPLVSIAVTVQVPTMVGKQIVDTAKRVELEPVKGTRTLVVTDPVVAGALAATGYVREVDKPTRKALDKQRDTTQDAINTAGGKTGKEE